jgi:hypothetical protein
MTAVQVREPNHRSRRVGGAMGRAHHEKRRRQALRPGKQAMANSLKKLPEDDKLRPRGHAIVVGGDECGYEARRSATGIMWRFARDSISDSVTAERSALSVAMTRREMSG